MRQKPESYEKELAQALSTLASLYRRNEQDDKMRALLLRIRDMYQELSKLQPMIYQTKLADAHLKLGNFHHERDGGVSKALASWRAGLELYITLAARESDKHDSKIHELTQKIELSSEKCADDDDGSARRYVFWVLLACFVAFIIWAKCR